MLNCMQDEIGRCTPPSNRTSIRYLHPPIAVLARQRFRFQTTLTASHSTFPDTTITCIRTGRMSGRSLFVLFLLAGLAAAALADAQISKVDGGKDNGKEAGQRKNGGSSGPDSWQFWGPNRQLLQNGNEKGEWTGAGLGGGHSGPGKTAEAGQRKNGGSSGPDSWQFWGPNRQLLEKGKSKSKAINEAGQMWGGNSGPDSFQAYTSMVDRIPTRVLLQQQGKSKSVNERAQRGSGGGSSGPDSWQFWGPNRQLLQNGNEKSNESGQRKTGGDSGPDSWQFWGPNRQLRSTGTLTRPGTQKSVNEAGQRSDRTQGGSSGPDSWQFWAPNRQLLQDGNEKGEWTGAGLGGGNFGPGKTAEGNEAGQRKNGGSSGPDSWQFWGPNRQLLNNGNKGKSVNERAQRSSGGGSSGPDSWQFWGPNRQLLKQEAGKQVTPTANPAKAPTQPAAAAKKPESAPKPAAPTQPAAAAKKPEAAPKPAAPTKPAAAAKKPEAAPKQQAHQQAPKQQPERGFRGWGWAANADVAGMPGGGQAYPLMAPSRNIYSAAGWGGQPTTCAQGEFAHACSGRKKLLLKK